MTRQKYSVELTMQAMRDAVDTMNEQVAILHERARHRRNGNEMRVYADRIADSLKEIRESMYALQKRLSE